MYVPSDLKTELRRESAILGSAMLLYFVLGTGLTVIASAAMSLFTGQGVSDFYEGGYGTVAVLADICCYLLSFAVPAYLLSKGMEWPLARPKKPFGLLTVPTFFVMLQAVNIFTSVFNELFRRVGIKGYSAGLELPGTPLGWLLFLMQYTLLPAVFEELLFRGAILGRLRRFGEWFAVFFSSMLFALLHGSVAAMPGIFLMASVFGYITLASRSLIPSMVMHFLNNVLAVFDLVTGENPDPAVRGWFSAALLGLGVLSAFVLFGVYLVNQKKTEGESLLKEPPPEWRKGRWHILLSPPMIGFLAICAAITVELESL